MPRLLLISGLALFLGVAALAATVGFLAYGTQPVRSGSLAVEGLTQPVSIAWPDDGPPVIEAADEVGLFTALGYVHAADEAWAMALLRRAALGRLAAWLGAGYDAHDRHARTLGFGAVALETYLALPEADRAVLDAYVSGVNRAMGEAAVAQRDEFVLLDVQPEMWRPWDPLAVERLVAWLGAPPLAPDSAAADAAVERFMQADASFRALLQLGGMSQSRAWTMPQDGATVLVQHHPYGRSALPLLRPLVLGLGARRTLAATVPGTLALPAGQGGAHAWSVFLTSTLSLTPTEAPLPPPVYDRLVDRDGNETLLTINRSADGLFFKAEPPDAPPVAVPAPADTTNGVPVPKTPAVWQIRWSGFAPGADLGAWRALLAGEAPDRFGVLRGDGLARTDAGETTVLGSPPVEAALPGGVFVAADTLARPAAAFLRTALADSAAVSRPLALATYSAWAADRLPGLIAALGDRDSLAADLKDPHAYLLSWDHRYTPDAIGASLFEQWLVAHRSITGSLPVPSDSANRPLLQQTLRLAVAILRDRHGDAPVGWRWDRVQPGTRVFPIWNARDETPARFAPVEPAPGGHPTAPRPGPSLVFGEPPAPAVWSAWTSSADGDRLLVHHAAVATEGFLARARSALDGDAPLVLRRDAPLADPLTLRPTRE